MTRNDVRLIAVNSTFLLTARIFSFAIGAAYLTMLARYLGPDLFGLFSYAQTWCATFFPFSAFGLGLVLIRDIPRDPSRGGQILTEVMSTRVLTTCVAMILCFGIGIWMNEDAEIRAAILIMSLALCGRALAFTAENAFNAYESTKYTFTQEMIFRPLEVIIGTVALVMGGGAIAVICAHALIWWAQGLMGLKIMRRISGARMFGSSVSGIMRVLRRGLPVFFAFGLSGWLMQLPLVAFRHLSGDLAAVGQLGLALQVFAILYLIPFSVSMAALPSVSRAARRGDHWDHRYICMTSQITIIVGSVMGLAALSFSRTAVEFIFGSAYLDASNLVAFAVWLLIPSSLGNIASQALLVQGRLWNITAWACAGLGTMTASLLWISNAPSPMGVLTATGFSSTVWSAGLMFELSRTGAVTMQHALFRPAIVASLSVTVWVLAHEIGVHSFLDFGMGLAILLLCAFLLEVPNPKQLAYKVFVAMRRK